MFKIGRRLSSLPLVVAFALAPACDRPPLAVTAEASAGSMDRGLSLDRRARDIRRPPSCGDKVCQGGGNPCGSNQEESCLLCPEDCGPCDWQLIHGPVAGATSFLFDVWASSAFEMWAVGQSGILYFDGVEWWRNPSGSYSTVWGSSPSDLYVSGLDPTLHFDGTDWSEVFPGMAYWGMDCRVGERQLRRLCRALLLYRALRRQELPRWQREMVPELVG